MGGWTTIVAGSHHRKTRFHDEKGNRVDFGGMAYAVPAFFSALAKVAFGIRPVRPMISYRGQRELDRLIRSDWRVVEFGSGRSTPWLAGRCAFVLSIEDNPDWHRTVGEILRARRLDNVRHELRGVERYADLSDQPDGSFDLALVDGTDRTGCVASAVSKIKPGGWLYLDNSDKDMTVENGDLRRAEAALRQAVAQRGGSLRAFTDFSPTNFFAEQGLLARL